MLIELKLFGSKAYESVNPLAVARVSSAGGNLTETKQERDRVPEHAIVHLMHGRVAQIAVEGERREIAQLINDGIRDMLQLVAPLPPLSVAAPVKDADNGSAQLEVPSEG